MGIKYLYTWLNTFCKCSLRSTAVPITNLYVDLNGVIHETAEKTYGYGSYHHDASRLRELSTIRRSEDVSTFLSNLSTNLNRIINVINPTRIVYIAIDGVAPRSKQEEQRRRRRCSVDSIFEPNNITAGTPFMRSVSTYLKCSDWCANRSIHLEIDDDLNPGEGEHKIMRKIKSETVTSPRCIYGIDSDIVMLCLLADRSDLYINRNLASTIDVDVLKRHITTTFSIPSKDFVVLLYLLGNDHIVPMLDSSVDGINYLLTIYALTKSKLIDSNNRINFDSFKRLLTRIVNRRDASDVQTDGPVDAVPNAVPDATIRARAYSYIKTLQWIYFYYVDTIVPEWNWFYAYVDAPSPSDVIALLSLLSLLSHDDDDVRIRFVKDEPCDIIENLLRILPTRNHDIIPISIV